MSDSVERSMFYGAKPELFERARMLRRNMTDCEQLLWNRLNKKQVLGFRFKCQHPMDIFVVDFYCHALRLVIEIDGENHMEASQKEYDENRSAEIEKYDILIIRFTNQEVMTKLDYVFEQIVKTCEQRKKVF